MEWAGSPWPPLHQTGPCKRMHACMPAHPGSDHRRLGLLLVWRDPPGRLPQAAQRIRCRRRRSGSRWRQRSVRGGAAGLLGGAALLQLHLLGRRLLLAGVAAGGAAVGAGWRHAAGGRPVPALDLLQGDCPHVVQALHGGPAWGQRLGVGGGALCGAAQVCAVGWQPAALARLTSRRRAQLSSTADVLAEGCGSLSRWAAANAPSPVLVEGGLPPARATAQ